MKHNLSKLIAIVVGMSLVAGCQQQASKQDAEVKQTVEQTQPRNVLFISIDDLRPEIGAYGSPIAKTPNIDALASKGITFTRAYAQQAICGPSRASIMTGLRPDTLEVTHNYVKFRHKFRDVKTIPQHFMQNGYNASYVGKIFHHGDKDEENSWNFPQATHLMPEDMQSPPIYALESNNKLRDEYKKLMFAKYGEQAKYGLGRGPATEGADVPDYEYIDGYNAELGERTLAELVKAGKPFFFGFGMNKPHLPWIAPKKYWDMYDEEAVKATLAQTRQVAPKDGAAMGLHASFELRTFSDVPNTEAIPDELALQLKHSYLACVSYVDEQIGRIIQALKDQGVYDNTVIILWSDHGFHLGDMGIWGKASNYEIATRVPFIISTPETRAQGQALKTDALVELLDIYPTAAELANIPMPTHTEGTSLKPLLDNPNTKWKESALSQFPTPALREWGAFPLRPGMRETYFGELIVQVEQSIEQQFPHLWDKETFEQNVMGYSLRTDDYRLIAWMNSQDKSAEPFYVELYDHRVDPAESTNVATKQTQQVARLMQILRTRIN
ncbi:sulfatase [Catenovulum agarivorans DS-2]|uniref:Sulfatase n=1 Tax=Catenovulum agarivorans DS-2 TaxID=1328313 RepID=W7QBQ0_9ALTE|nr:sulfatase [Catenovulum agarivorans]EWH10259.1 sulfatase [Catenovulum agarivorans DS-2]